MDFYLSALEFDSFRRLLDCTEKVSSFTFKGVKIFSKAVDRVKKLKFIDLN